MGHSRPVTGRLYLYLLENVEGNDLGLSYSSLFPDIYFGRTEEYYRKISLHNRFARLPIGGSTELRHFAAFCTCYEVISLVLSVFCGIGDFEIIYKTRS